MGHVSHALLACPSSCRSDKRKKLPMPKGKGSDVVRVRCKNAKNRVLHAHMGLEGLMPGICQPMRGEVSSLETTGQSCSPPRQQIWDMQDGLVCKHGITAVGFSQGIHADAQLCASIYDITVPQDNVIVHCPPYCIRDCFVLTARKRARLVHITTKTGFERAPLENFFGLFGGCDIKDMGSQWMVLRNAGMIKVPVHGHSDFLHDAL